MTTLNIEEIIKQADAELAKQKQAKADAEAQAERERRQLREQAYDMAAKACGEYFLLKGATISLSEVNKEGAALRFEGKLQGIPGLAEVYFQKYADEKDVALYIGGHRRSTDIRQAIPAARKRFLKQEDDRLLQERQLAEQAKEKQRAAVQLAAVNAARERNDKKRQQLKAEFDTERRYYIVRYGVVAVSDNGDDRYIDTFSFKSFYDQPADDGWWDPVGNNPIRPMHVYAVEACEGKPTEPGSPSVWVQGMECWSDQREALLARIEQIGGFENEDYEVTK